MPVLKVVQIFLREDKRTYPELIKLNFHDGLSLRYPNLKYLFILYPHPYGTITYTRMNMEVGIGKIDMVELVKAEICKIGEAMKSRV